MNDVTRFNHFNEFRNCIRGSRTHLIVGIDISKDKHHAFSVPPMARHYGADLYLPMISSTIAGSLNRSRRFPRAISLNLDLKIVLVAPGQAWHQKRVVEFGKWLCQQVV